MFSENDIIDDGLNVTDPDGVAMVINEESIEDKCFVNMSIVIANKSESVMSLNETESIGNDVFMELIEEVTPTPNKYIVVL